MPEEENDPVDDQKPEGDGGNNENGDGGEPNATPNNGNDQPKDGELAQDNDPDDNEPPVKTRKTAKDFIIERKNAKIAKLEAQKNAKANNDSDDDSDDDDDVLPEDRKAILKTVAPVLKPFIEKSLQAEDEAELQEFVKDNPEFAPFTAKARNFMKHPSRRNIPIETIFMEAAGGINGIMKLGAQRLKNANDKARNGQTGGGSIGSDGNVKSWKEASDAELEAEKERVRREHRR